MNPNADDERPAHHFTVDVEEYFHASALEPHLDRFGWEALESRVERSVDDLLALLDAADARATFFVLGWVARRHPGMVRRIADAGHEIGSHGWGHRRIEDLGPGEFRTSVRRSRQLLQDVAGTEVIGFRAPNFSLVPGAEWALDILLEEGYRYDSSIYPIRRPGYGYPAAEPTLHRVLRSAGTLLEFPPATLKVMGATLPAGGGAYFRVLPYGLVQRALRAAEDLGEPATFYIHPWELDPGQPRFSVSRLTRIRQYAGLERMKERLRRLLEEFRFRSIEQTLNDGPVVATSPQIRLQQTRPETSVPF